MAPTTLIQNLNLLATMNDRRDILHNAYVYIDGPRIAALGQGIPPLQAEHTIDGGNSLLIPGLINTHHHLIQVLTKNIPLVQTAGLFQWLITLYQIWREITPEAVYAASLTGMAELLASGCTCTSDHLYLFPQQNSEYFIDRQIEAARKIGIRFQPCRGAMSRGQSQGGLPPDDICQQEDVILKDCRRLLEMYHDPAPLAMTRISLGPCAPFNVTDQLMKATVRLAREYQVNCHTHLAETLDEEEYCLKTYGCRPFDYLERLGWLGEDIWLAHCIHLNSREIQHMGKTGTGIAHCPTSNLRLGSGIAPLRNMLDHLVPVGLGVDGSASNDSSHMLAEARQCMLVHRLAPDQHWITAEEALWMATRGGARVLGRDDIGSIEVGKAADLILLRLDKPAYAGAWSDPLAAILYNLSTDPVDLTMVHGRIVYQTGRCTYIDEKEAIRETNRHAAEMLSQAQRKSGMDFTRRPAFRISPAPYRLSK